MLTKFKLLTVTHRRTNLKDIGNYVVKTSTNQNLEDQLLHLKQQFGLEELLYVPTCNRVLYLLVTEHPVNAAFAAHFFQSINPELSIDQLENIEDQVLIYEGEAAVDHLFQVAASIDSMVIGERQILRQLREAYEESKAMKLTGDGIRLAFQQAVLAAKGVYAQTRIGEKPVSVVSLAIQKMLKRHLPKDARILLIGAGQTNQLAAKFLNKHHFHNVVVFNRSLERAVNLAQSFQGSGFSLEQLHDYQGGFDCLIVCTGSTEPVITPNIYRQLLQGEDERKLVIDLAIPNNVHEAVVEQFSLDYIEIEGLRQLAKENFAFREQEVQRALKILQGYTADFARILKQRELELALRQLPEAIQSVRVRAQQEVFGKELAELDEPTQALIDRMLTYMEKKCIGIPMKVAKEAFLAAV
ncbi:MAG TPA: glutamyl-tRNA reductase [Saprospiraceae bacterium]|nr:glutamyl-tRNA reductase [Saprospiraceae bacterium]HMQ85540.1 glutamyl-tRNA reductase [Saprospiraceae bacterium]